MIMPYPETRTYWLERTDQVAVGLRRYTMTGRGGGCQEGFHAAILLLGPEPAVWRDSVHGRSLEHIGRELPHDSPAWPKRCEKGCGYEFTPDDEWQSWQELLYERAGTDGVVTLRVAPPGAMWDAWWLPDLRRGPDGIALMVRCPNGPDWFVDGRASNCTLPSDDVHRCWVRHGDPRAAAVTVDKNGFSCHAGAGSIQAGDYHGFLHDGVLTAG